MYEGPEFRHLHYFTAVAEECNMNRAALRLNVSQPTLSEQIKQLEEGLKTKLFLRNRAGSALTSSGRAFLPYARDMLDMRTKAVRATSPEHSGIQLPLRFGYSPFVSHLLVDDALTGFGELVPEGRIEPHSETTARLVAMVLGGELEAALVTRPIPLDELFVQNVCEERVYVCLRRDDPLAQRDELPREVIGDRLRVLFDRLQQPMFYDKLVRKFAKIDVALHPSEFASSPAEMHFLVARGKGMGIALESTEIPETLVKKSVAGLPLKIVTAFICLRTQKRPVLPMLAFQVSQRCHDKESVRPQKKPVGSVTIEDISRRKEA